MKFKREILYVSAIITMLAPRVHAAVFIVSNVLDAETELVFADSNGVRLASGVATIGYFPAGFAVSTNLSLSVLISNFTIVNSGSIGAPSVSFAGFSFPGYVENDQNVTIPNVTTGNPLLGRPIFTFIGNGSTLDSSTAFGLVQTATFLNDVPNEKTYGIATVASTPTIISTLGTPIIGTLGTAVFELPEILGPIPLTHPTLNLSPIPEPSAALLGLIGAGVLFRRRRA